MMMLLIMEPNMLYNRSAEIQFRPFFFIGTDRLLLKSQMRMSITCEKRIFSYPHLNNLDISISICTCQSHFSWEMKFISILTCVFTARLQPTLSWHFRTSVPKLLLGVVDRTKDSHSGVPGSIPRRSDHCFALECVRRIIRSMFQYH